MSIKTERDIRHMLSTYPDKVLLDVRYVLKALEDHFIEEFRTYDIELKRDDYDDIVVDVIRAASIYESNSFNETLDIRVQNFVDELFANHNITETEPFAIHTIVYGAYEYTVREIIYLLLSLDLIQDLVLIYGIYDLGDDGVLELRLMTYDDIQEELGYIQSIESPVAPTICHTPLKKSPPTTPKFISTSITTTYTSF